MSSNFVPLGLEVIDNGRLVEQANKLIREVEGFYDRNPSMEKGTKLVIEVVFEPEIHEETQEFALNHSFVAYANFPKRRSRVRRAKRGQDGTYLVNASPHMQDPERSQMHIGEAIDAAEAAAQDAGDPDETETRAGVVNFARKAANGPGERES